MYVSLHTEFVVILSLVCKGIYMKDCTQVHAVVFQIIIDNFHLNGYILVVKCFQKIFKENYGIKGSLSVL